MSKLIKIESHQELGNYRETGIDLYKRTADFLILDVHVIKIQNSGILKYLTDRNSCLLNFNVFTIKDVMTIEKLKKLFTWTTDF